MAAFGGRGRYLRQIGASGTPLTKYDSGKRIMTGVADRRFKALRLHGVQNVVGDGWLILNNENSRTQAGGGIHGSCRSNGDQATTGSLGGVEGAGLVVLNLSAQFTFAVRIINSPRVTMAPMVSVSPVMPSKKKL